MKRVLICILMLTFLLPVVAHANEEMVKEFDKQLIELLSPAELALKENYMTLRVGDECIIPYVSSVIIPFDKKEETVIPELKGEINSNNNAVLSVEGNTMKALSAGIATLSYMNGTNVENIIVEVTDDGMPYAIQNYRYVINREFLTTARKHLGRGNIYTKWYYKSNKEVGWCSVYTIYCVNASGNKPLSVDDMDTTNPPTTMLLKEGQVGNQYDRFFEVERFLAVPKPGYLVIYADMDNAYRTVHIATVVDVVDQGNGIYDVTTVEGNMSSTVKRYTYRYDSNQANNMEGGGKDRKLRWNMQEVPEELQTDILTQYELHTDHWSVFGFCATWPY